MAAGEPTIALTESVQVSIPTNAPVPAAGTTLPIPRALMTAINNDALVGKKQTNSQGQYQLSAQVKPKSDLEIVLLGVISSAEGHRLTMATERENASFV